MKQGFTLIEVVAVLLLVGVLALASTIALLPMVEGLWQVRRNVEGAQKTHIAMNRILNEFITITNVVSAGPRSITYDFLDPAGTVHRRTLAWSGEAGAPLTLNGVALSDDVSAFELRYYVRPGGAASTSWGPQMRLIECVYGTVSGGDIYTNHIRPRNIPKVQP